MCFTYMGSETEFDCSEVQAENRKEKILVKNLKKHVCPFAGCNSSFNRPSKLNRHVNVHTKQRPFKCDHPGCSKDYTNKSHLDRHKCTSHSLSKPVPIYIPCPYPDCNKIFLNKWSVKRHCNIHKGKNLYDCDQCGCSFKKSRQLKLHVNIHLGVKPYVCNECKESFESQKELKWHKKKHKVYNCEQEGCQQQFNTWNALRKHIKLCHFTFYKCDSCSKIFKNKWTLTEHVFSHLPTDHRDAFPCPHNDCKRFYFHQRNLEHHLRSFHQNINYNCDFENCGQTFVKKIHLAKHKKLKHTEIKSVKESPPKIKHQRKPRNDKGLPRRSMTAMLSGIILPYKVEKNLAQNKITPEVLETIQNVKETLLKESIFHDKINSQ